MARNARLSTVAAGLISIGAAVWLWLWAAAASGKVEAWDGPYYFSWVVPALWVVALGCGLLAPRWPWRWPVAMYAAQFILMVARTEGRIGPLAPIGFITMGILAVVTMLPAYLGSYVRHRCRISADVHQGQSAGPGG
jgi:hypothetical protein